MKYNKILQVSRNKLNDKEASKIFDKLLNKTTVKRESNKAEIQHIVLAYLFTNGLLENGYIIDLSVEKITKELGISRGPVNTVLGIFGYKYERDRVTPKQDNGSQGLVDRYFKFEYVENKLGNRVKKYSKSVFSLVVNEKLYAKFDELGITEYNKIPSDKLQELHNQIKDGSYTKKTIFEHPEDMPVVYKQTDITYNEDGQDVDIQYHGLKEMVEWANEILEGKDEEIVIEEHEIIEDIFELHTEDKQEGETEMKLPERKPITLKGAQAFYDRQKELEEVEEEVEEEEETEEVVEEEPKKQKVTSLNNTAKQGVVRRTARPQLRGGR